MSYRDDVDAVYERAATLQREVDKLRAQLESRSSSVEAERQKAQIEARMSRAELEREQDQLEARAARADAERQRALREASSSRAEVARLNTELAARARGPTAVPPHMRERERPVWLPPGADEPRGASSAAPAADPQLGLLVARLTVAEHAIVRRLLELLTEDKFDAPAIRRNLRALDELIADLRVHLATNA